MHVDQTWKLPPYAGKRMRPTSGSKRNISSAPVNANTGNSANRALETTTVDAPKRAYHRSA
jgi:hypothetical protein